MLTVRLDRSTTLEHIMKICTSSSITMLRRIICDDELRPYAVIDKKRIKEGIPIDKAVIGKVNLISLKELTIVLFENLDMPVSKNAAHLFKLFQINVSKYFGRMGVRDIILVNEAGIIKSQVYESEDILLFSKDTLQEVDDGQMTLEQKLIVIGFEDKTGWDIALIYYVNDGLTRSEIASRLHKSSARVNNRVSELRHILGSDAETILPMVNVRRKRK
jgi:hypothetical protein